MSIYLPVQKQGKVRNWRRSKEKRQSVYDAEHSTRSGDSNKFFGCMQHCKEKQPKQFVSQFILDVVQSAFPEKKAMFENLIYLDEKIESCRRNTRQ
jgi:hypothetical protein